MYASENDNPLRLSHEVHGYPRLGEAGENLVVMQGLDTIDVSISAGREVTGHLYHLYNDRVRADLGFLLRDNMAADKRPFLKKHIKDGLPFWLLMPADQ